MHHLPTITLPHDLSAFDDIIDVRSPKEWTQDHIPHAINLPVLTDRERHQIGILHRNDAFQARRQGAAIVARNAAHHLSHHLADKPADYRPLIYCWRGGMRSQSFTHILHSIGWQAHILQGGYRSFRHHVMEDLARLLPTDNHPFIILTGMTGVGKTLLLEALHTQGAQVLDLEALAAHRGSLLGQQPDRPQPSQKHFETQLWHTLRAFDHSRPIFTEAESHRIGNVHLPEPLWQAMSQPRELIHLDLPLRHRVDNLHHEYPHHRQDPATLEELLSHLVRLRGHEQVEAWQAMVRAGTWPELIQSLLADHYDLAYRQPGHEKSNYPEPHTTITLPDNQPDTYRATAAELIATRSH